MLKNTVAGIIGLVVAGSILFLVESGSRLVLNSKGLKTYPLVYNRSKKSSRFDLAYQQGFQGDLVVSDIDPHLGFSHDKDRHGLMDEFSGFVRYGNGNLEDPKTRVVVALGGSTTDSLTPLYLGDNRADPNDPYNWPRSLQKLLVQSGFEAVVFNGGVAGYSSNQQLIKLIRDALPLEPDLILTLEGVNEMGFAHSVPAHPMVHPYQLNLFSALSQPMESAILPNMVGLVVSYRRDPARSISGASWGIPQNTTPWDQWLKNSRLARAICDEFDIEYLIGLQPILGYGNYSASDVEIGWLKSKGPKYRTDLTEFYDHATQQCEQLEYLLDMTNVFSDLEGVYLDARHQNQLGVDRLAEEFKGAIRERGLMDRHRRRTSSPMKTSGSR